MKELGYQKENNLTSIMSSNLNLQSGVLKKPHLPLIYNNRTCFFYRNNITFYQEWKKEWLLNSLFWREGNTFQRPLQIKKRLKTVKEKTEILSQYDQPRLLVSGYQDEDKRPKPIGGTKWGAGDYQNKKTLSYLSFKYSEVLAKVQSPILDIDVNKKDKEDNYKVKKEWLRKSLTVGGKKFQVLINKYKIPYYWTTNTPGNYAIPLPFMFTREIMKGGNVYHQDTGEKIGDLLSKGDLIALPIGKNKNRQIIITKWGHRLIKKHGVEGINYQTLHLGDAEGKTTEILNSVHLTLTKPLKSTFISPPLPKTKPTIIFPTNKLVKEGQRKNIVATFLRLVKNFIFDKGKPIHKIKLGVNGVNKDCFVHSYHREKYSEWFENGKIKVGSRLNLVLLGGKSLNFIDSINLQEKK